MVAERHSLAVALLILKKSAALQTVFYDADTCDVVKCLEPGA